LVADGAGAERVGVRWVAGVGLVNVAVEVVVGMVVKLTAVLMAMTVAEA
jgi:hypothetical protein